MKLKGINKFTKKFRKPPGYIDNTEILDYLSRVPSIRELYHFSQIKLDKNNLNQESPRRRLNDKSQLNDCKENKKKK